MENETSEMIVKRVSVPIGLEELMEGLSKEVLLKKPDDLYEFAARYFSKLLLLRDKTNYKVKTVRSAQTVTEQNRRLTRAPYGSVPKTLSRQFSIRDHSATRQLRIESPRRHIHPQNDSLVSKREPSKTCKNEVTQQSSTKKTETATEQLEPSVNKVAFSSRRPKRRYDSKRSSSNDKNESQSKGTKSSNASASESADTLERTEMIPKRRESNSSTLSNVPSIESSEAKFNTDSPTKAPKDTVKDGSTLSTPRDKSSSDKAKISKQEVSASETSGKDKVEDSSGTKSLRNGKVTKRSTSKVSPRSDLSKCDTQRSTGSEGGNSKGTSPSKMRSKVKSLKGEEVIDKSSKNDDTHSTSRSTGDQSKKDITLTSKNGQATTGLADASAADHLADKASSKAADSTSSSLGDSGGNKVIVEYSAKMDISKAIESISASSKNEEKNELPEISGQSEGNAKTQKDSYKSTTSADVSQKDPFKDGIIDSDSTGKSRMDNRTLESTSLESESNDKLQIETSNNKKKDNSDNIRNLSDVKSASNKLSQHSNTNRSCGISESSNHQSTDHDSKISATRDHEMKCSQINSKDKSESDLCKASEEKIQDSLIPTSGTPLEKLPTCSKVTGNQSSADSNSEMSQNELNQKDDTKILSKNESESISIPKDDRNGKCVSTSELSDQVLTDTKHSPRNRKDESVGKISLKHKSSPDKSSSGGTEGMKADLEVLEHVVQSSTLKNQPPPDVSLKNDSQKEKSTASMSKNQSPQKDLMEIKNQRKDNHSSYEYSNITDKNKTSSAEKTLSLDESPKIVQQDIESCRQSVESDRSTAEDTHKDNIKNCMDTSKDISKSDKTSSVKGNDTFTENISNHIDTLLQPEVKKTTQIKSGDDLSVSDFKRENSRVSDKTSSNSESAKSRESSSVDRSKYASKSETAKLIEESHQQEPSIEVGEDTSVHSATSFSQTDKLEDHGDKNSGSLSGKSAQLSTAEKQEVTKNQGVSEDKVTNSTESSKNIPTTNDKDPSVEPIQLPVNISSVIPSGAVDKERLSISEEEVASVDVLEASRPSEKNIEKHSNKDVIAPIPSNMEESTSDTITTDNHFSKGEESKKDDPQRKSIPGSSEAEPMANLTKEGAIRVTPQCDQRKNIESTTLTTEPTDERVDALANVMDNLTIQTNEGGSDRSRQITKIQDVSDPKLTNTKAKIDENDTKHEPVENADSSRSEKSSSEVEPKQGSSVDNKSQELKIGTGNTNIAEDMAISLIGRQVHDRSPKLSSGKDASDVNVKTIENQTALPQKTEADSKGPSSSTSSTETKTIAADPEFKNISDNEPMSIISTNLDKIINKTDKLDENSYEEHNTKINSNKHSRNEEKGALLNAEAANGSPNTSGQNEKIDTRSSNTGSELERPSLADEAISTCMETKISNNEGNVMEPFKDSTVSHELSSSKNNSLKSAGEQQETSTKRHQADLLKSSKKLASGKTASIKSASQEKLKKVSHKSLSVETVGKHKSSRSDKFDNPPLKSGLEESPRADNNISENDYAKKPATYLRYNGDKGSTSKNKGSDETSKNSLVSPKKLLLPGEDCTVGVMSDKSSSSSAGSSKLSSNKEQSVDSGNNSLTTSSSEKELPKESHDVMEAQVTEKRNSSSSHKRALQRSSKVEESSSKSMSTSKGSPGSNDEKPKPTTSKEKSRSPEKIDRTGEQRKGSGSSKASSHSNADAAKGPVLDMSENNSENLSKMSVSPRSVDKEINHEAKASEESEIAKVNSNIPPDAVQKNMNSDSSEKGSPNKASKIPVKVNHKDDLRANGSVKASSGALNTNLLSVKNFELEKDEAKRMEQELEDSKPHASNHDKKNYADGMSEEDRLILEKLNIDITKQSEASHIMQPVDQNHGSNNIGTDGKTDIEEPITETIKTNKLAENGPSESQTESVIGKSNRNNDDVSKIPSDELHLEHTKDVSKYEEADTSIVDKDMPMSTENHSVSKRATEESSMSKNVGLDEEPNTIQLTLQHKSGLHPDVKDFINRFIQNEQTSVYKEHCLCREVRLHDDKVDADGDTSSEKQKQVLNGSKAESGKTENATTTSSTTIEQNGVKNDQSEVNEGDEQINSDLVGLTLNHEERLHPDVKGFIGNFIEKEQANVYKEHCSCKEVRLHDTSDDNELNEKDRLSSSTDERTTTIRKQRSEEPATHVDDKLITRSQSLDSTRPNGYLNYKIPTAEVKGIQALTVQDQNGKFINKSNENNEERSRFDIAKLREELERVQGESKMNTFHNSYNPYKLRQELKQYSSTASDRNNNTHKTFSAANAVLKIQSMWRGFLVRKVLKHDEDLEKRSSPVRANGVLKSGSGEKPHGSATIIANGGHTIPKDTRITDPPIEVSLKGQQKGVDKDSSSSTEINNKLEATVSSQTSGSETDRSATTPSAVSNGVQKSESEHKTNQDTENLQKLTDNGDQKFSKDANVIGTEIKAPANGTEANSNNLEGQVPSKAFNNKFNEPGVINSAPGSTLSTTEKVEALAKHSQNTPQGTSETKTGQNDQNSQSFETLNGGTSVISKESQMVAGQSGNSSPENVNNSGGNGKINNRSSDNPSLVPVLNDKLEISKDIPKTEALSERHLKEAPRHNSEEPKGSYRDMNKLTNQESSETSGSGVVNTLPDSEASNTEEEDRELEKAATSLQSMWRGFKARKENDVMNKKKEPVRTKRKIEDKDMRKVSSVSKEDAAALKIQSIWKAYVARKGIARFKDSLSTNKGNKQLNDADAAATKIQAHVRGHLLRKKIDREKRSAGDTEEYRPTSIDSTDSAITVISRGLLNDDDYESLNYDAALDHVAQMPLLKDENSITDYQNKLLAQISGRSEETSQNEESEIQSSKASKKPELRSTERREKTVMEVVDKSATDITNTDKSSVVSTEPKSAKGSHEKDDANKHIEYTADNARPQNRRGREENGKSVKQQVMDDSTVTEELAEKSDDPQTLHEPMKAASTSEISEKRNKNDIDDPDLTSMSHKNRKPACTQNNEAREVKVTAIQSYLATTGGPSDSDSLRSTSEMHDVVTIPQHLKEGQVEPAESKIITVDAKEHKSDSAIETENNRQGSSNSCIATTKTETQVPPKNLKPQENEKPDDENSSKSQQSGDGSEKMHLQHSSEMHDAILLPVGAGDSDFQNTEAGDDSKGTNPKSHKPLDSVYGNEGLTHSSEYHDSIVFPLRSENEERQVPTDISETNTNAAEGSSHQVVTQEDSKSEQVSLESGTSTGNKDLDGKSETDTGSPIGLLHSSELHDAVVLPEKVTQ
nr:unnamed protein product [Callosobruchus chinensis]